MIETLTKIPSDIKQSDRIIYLKPFQDDFIFSKARYPALVSSWGTGKTMSLIEKIRLHCEDNPGALVMFCRKEYTDLKDSSVKDWNENVPYAQVGSDRDAKFSNGSIVMFRHFYELRGNNLNNMNLSAFGMEQGEEADSDEHFFRLQGRLRRKGFPHFGAVIANTNGHNWIYNVWKMKKDKDYPLFEANSFEMEGIIPDDTLKSWKKLKDLKPTVYNRFVLNSWEESDTQDLIIHPEWVRRAINKPIFMNPLEIRRVVSIDVARYGDDKTVFYALENNKVMAMEYIDKKNTMETVGRVQIFAEKYLPTQNYAVDEIGVGAGVVDRLGELGKNVIPINGAKRGETVPEGCYNRRAEIYSYGAEMFESGNVSILPEDIKLHEQLSWAKYKEIKSNGVFQVEPKEDIKKRFGESPDFADAYLNGLWALTQVVPLSQVIRNRSDSYVHPRFLKHARI